MLIVGAGVLAYAWWVTGLRPFAWTSTVAVVAGGIVAMAFGTGRRRLRRRVPLRRTDVAAWVALVGALASWQLASYLQHPRKDHPTLSSLANALLDTHPARAAAFAVWLAGAVHLARR